MGLKKIKVAKKTPDKDSGLLSLSERWDLWFEKNSRYLIGGVVLLVALGGAIWGVTAYWESLEARARTEYVALLGKLPVVDGESPGEWEKRIPELDAYIQAHPGTKIVINARADLLQAFTKVGRYEDAVRQGNLMLKEIDPRHPLRPIAREQLAIAYDAGGKIDDALQQWNEMKREGFESYSRVISWNLARLHGKKGDFTRAAQEYEAALKTEGAYPDSALLEDELARVRLRAAPAAEGGKAEPAKGNS